VNEWSAETGLASGVALSARVGPREWSPATVPNLISAEGCS